MVMDVPCGTYLEVEADLFDVLEPALNRLTFDRDGAATVVLSPFRDWRVEVVDVWGESIDDLHWFPPVEFGGEDRGPGKRLRDGHVFRSLRGDRFAGHIAVEGGEDWHAWFPLRESSIRQNPDGTWTSRILRRPKGDEELRAIDLARGLAPQIAQARVVDAAGRSRACTVEDDELLCPGDITWRSLEVLWSGIAVTQSFPVPGVPKEITTRPTAATRCFRLPEGVVGSVSVGGSKAATFPPLEGGVGPEGPFSTCTLAPDGQDFWIRVERPGEPDQFGVFPAAWPQGAVVTSDGEEAGAE